LLHFAGIRLDVFDSDGDSAVLNLLEKVEEEEDRFNRINKLTKWYCINKLIPLQTAISKSYLKCAKVLLEHGADVNFAQEYSGETWYHPIKHFFSLSID